MWWRTQVANQLAALLDDLDRQLVEFLVGE